MLNKIFFGLAVIVAGVISFMLASFLELFLFSRVTPLFIPLNLLTFGAMAALVFGQLWLVGRNMFAHPARTAGIATASVVGVAMAFFAAAHASVRWGVDAVPLSEQARATLAEETVPLPGALLPPEQLEPLRPYLEGHRVVALGEATHGTSEFFELKHSVIRYLVVELGYRHYGMEISPEDGERLNAYIHGEEVPLSEVLYWPWATEEVVTMLDWMREYNASAPTGETLTLHGIDPRSGDRDRAMAENTLAILEEHGPESKIVLWAHNGHIRGREGDAGYYLRQALGEEAYLLGFAFNEGRFTSRTGVIDVFSVGPVPPNHYAYHLAQVSDSPVRFMDIETVQQANSELAAWLETPQASRSLAELYHVARRLPGQTLSFTPLPTLFDGLLYVETSTPAATLPSAE